MVILLSLVFFSFFFFLFSFFLWNVNETGWSVCRSLLGCCAPAVCRSGFARWCSCVLLFSGAFVRCVCGLLVVLRLGLLLLYSCLGSLLCFLPPLSCLRGLWWLVSLQGSPGSCHVMLSCPCIPSPCFRGLGVCVDLLKRSKTCQVFDSRGVRLIIPTWRNEAMVWWGMGGLINHLYLLHGHDEGDVQTLVTRVSFLGFCFKLLVPTHWRWNMHHYHEPGTECAISLIQVCVSVWGEGKEERYKYRDSWWVHEGV